MPSLLGPSLLISWTLYIPIVGSLICNGLLYGTPNINDCEQALLEIPFAREGSSSRSQTPQLFAEPRFQSPPFHLITNNLRPQAIVQLPKIWKHNSCRIALISQGVSASRVYRPIFTTRWQNIIEQSAQLRSCFSFKPPKGGWTKVTAGSNPAAILYMYDSGSVFSHIMNRYMSNGIPIIPGSDTLGGTGNATGRPLSLSLLTNITRTLSPTEVKLLDSR